MPLYDTAVLVALSDYLGDLFDSVIPLSDKIFFPSRLVRCSSIQNLLRAHRSLCHYSAQDLDNPVRSARSTSIGRHAPFRHAFSNRLEVTVHKAYEEHTMSQTDHYASYPSSDVQLPDKPHEINLDVNIEDRADLTRPYHVFDENLL
jgi:hypothetical protein